MNKNIGLTIVAALLVLGAAAQTKIDRSKRPKGGPAPTVTIPDPVIYTLPNGITVLVVENHKLPKVSASYSIDAGPVLEGDKAGVMSLMGSMLNEGTRTKPKAVFDEAVDQIGAEVSLSSNGGNASALTRYFDQAFMLMAEALKEPAMEQASFEKLKSQTLTSLKTVDRSVKDIAGRVTPALLYGIKHPSGEFETEATVSALTLADVKVAYAKYITPSRGFLTFVGDIKPEQAKSLAEKAFGSWKGATLTLPQLAAVKNPAATEIDLVDVPNAVQSEIRVANLVELPLSSPDYFAVLLANQILGGGSDSYLFKNLREKRAFTYGAYSSISAGRYQTAFIANASVRNEKTDSAVVEFLNEIKRIRTQKVNAEELTRAKALYNGNFALGMENTARIASFATNIIVNNLPKDFYRTYLQKLNAVTVEDVQRVAAKYFGVANSRIIVTGKASQVEPGLKKLGYSVHLYDKLAQPVKAGAAAATVSADAKEVINNYLKAIGGTEALRKVKTVWYKMTLSVQGMSLAVEKKDMVPNKTLTVASAMGNVVDKQVFDGNTGYQERGGQKMTLPADQLNSRKGVTSMFEQLDYVPGVVFKLVSKGISKVDGKDAYVIEVTNPGGKMQAEYYDVASKLLVRVESALEMNGMPLNQTTDFSDYRKVGAILIPYKFVQTIEAGGQQQALEFVTTDVKLNEGVSEGDFK
ncbi:M16 family metallopeptidase [Filimonas effusa]|nr:pitrilysin family protein [Filimonas effusa]